MINVDTLPPALDEHHHLRVCFPQNVLSIHFNQSITWRQTRKRQRKSETPCEPALNLSKLLSKLQQQLRTNSELKKKDALTL